MPAVSCPSCATRQAVDASATSYTCSSCGTPWDLVVCTSCASRFHAKPGSSGWTCPTCGTRNERPPAAGAVPAMSVSGDDLDAVAPESPGGPQEPFGTPQPGSSFPMPEADRRRGFPRWGFVVIGAVVVAVIGLILITRDGDDTPADAPTPDAQQAVAAVCTHVQQLTQILRDDALGRAQDTLRQDVAALREAGDAATAKQVKILIARIEDLRTAYQDQTDTTAPSAAMGKAVAALPC